MKIRILALCLAFAVALTLAGCKKEKKTAPATTPEQTTLEQTTPPETTPMDTTAVTVPLDTNPVVPQDRVEGTYEQWLAAASVQVTTMLMYPDCQVKGVYALSETDFDKKMDSKGVAIQIINAGSELWILSTPLEEERSLANTMDLKAAGIGFNTYDEVDPLSLPPVIQLDMVDLQPYIDQTMLPSIYMR